MASKGKGRRPRCSVCLCPLDGPGGRCDECKALVRGLTSDQRVNRTLDSALPGRAERIAEYTRRADLRTPLFE